LKQAGIAVWDVLRESVRPGSMDSAISVQTSVANDLHKFLLEHNNIAAICFNGQTAAKIFDRQIRPSISTGHREIVYYVMPSTSPAYASMSLQDKQRQWSRLLDHL
jgi:hypoxanthine-DNA glycosylase